jgi:hypothetical protein
MIQDNQERISAADFNQKDFFIQIDQNVFFNEPISQLEGDGE